jgi:mono/diheme cytochrome c family protein
MVRTVGLVLALMTAGAAADFGEGQKEERRACVGCHGLRIVHVQRLSRAAWEREVKKMEGWGSVVRNREALLEYLVANFGDDKAQAAPVLSKDGRK